MHGLIYSFNRLVWRRPSTLIGLLVTAISLGFFTRLSYHHYLYLQAQNIDQISVFNELLMPLAGLTLFCQLVMITLVAVQLMPTFQSLRQNFLLEQASISPASLLTRILTPIVLAGFWPLVYFVAISVAVATSSELDLGRLGLTVAGLLIINLIASLLVFALCNPVKSGLAAALIAAVVLALILVLESSLWYWWPGAKWQGIFNPLFRFREGVLTYADLVASLGWLITGASGCFLLMSRHLVLKRALPRFALAAGLVLAVSASYINGQVDLTGNQRNSLTSTTENLLKEQQSRLQVTATIDKETARDEISRGFEIVQRSYPNSQLNFRPRQSLSPELQHQGEYVNLQLGDLHQIVAFPFEHPAKVVFELAIEQMLRRKTQWITFIEGHGESSPFGQSSSDLKQFYRILTAMGWPVAVQNLAQTPLISDNTQILVIASSKRPWDDAETDLVLSYLQSGGNLLLLCDPDSYVPQKLEAFIGVNRTEGTLVDWNGYQSGTPHPAIVIVNQFTSHPVVSQLNSLLAFPWASGLQKSDAASLSWQIEPIVLSAPGVWNEFQIQQEQLVYEPQLGESQQSFPLAMAAYQPANQQKIVVVGDSHFVSDSAINNYANNQFALNLVSWLSNVALSDHRLSKQLDSSLKLSRSVHWTLSWGFSLAGPVLLLIIWLLLRFQRRR